MRAESPCVYVLLTRTDTGVGKIIRFVMRGSRYNHVSIALDDKLYAMYSFARNRMDSPFSAGFVREYPSRYLAFERDAEVKLFRVPLTPEALAALRKRLAFCRANSGRMLYNLPDAMLLPFGRRFSLTDSYTCLAFAESLLDMGKFQSIDALEKHLAPYVVYEGSLRAMLPPEWCAPRSIAELAYFEREGRIAAMHDFFVLCRGLWTRRAGR